MGQSAWDVARYVTFRNLDWFPVLQSSDLDDAVLGTDQLRTMTLTGSAKHAMAIHLMCLPV
jgi:hypothetical protein